MELIGRERETNEVLAALAKNTRVITLWGPGGIGKTSLARVIAGSPDFSEGHVFVPAATARSASDLYAIAAGTLALGPAATRTEEEEVARLGRSIAARGRTLVVLDNAEQIVADIAHAVAAWIAAAPKATFLITSRTLLGLSNEVAYELLPLRLDNADVPDAVQLLEARARAVRPSFEADRETLARIAARVEGIPLAIELAAARLAVMSAPQLLARLGDRLEVLGRDHGGAEQRQRTLRSTIAWSWDLLGESERRALAELAATRGFDLEAAEAIVSGDAVGLVTALRQQSLLAPIVAEPPRFFILDTIREFAALERPDDERRGADRHAAFHARRAAEHTARLRGEGGEAAMAELVRESDNLLALVERFCAEPSAAIAPLALRALVGLEPVLAARGALVALAELGQRAIDASDAFEIDGNDRARALETLGTALLAMGRLARSRASFERANALATGDERARAMERLASVLWAEGRGDEALDRITNALALALAEKTPALRAQCLSTRGVILHTSDRFDEARACYEGALALAREIGDRRWEIRVRLRLGFLLHDFGDPSAALEQYAAAREIGDRYGVRDDGTLDGYVGNARRATGDLAGAVDAYDTALEQLRRSGNRMYEATFTMDRGIAWTIHAKYDEAIRDLELAIVLSREVGSKRLTVLTWGYLVVCHVARGDTANARRVLDEARKIADAPEQELLDLHEGHLLEPAEARARLARLETPILGQHRRVAADLLRRATDRASPPEDALVFDGAQIAFRGACLRLGAAKLGVVRLLVERRIARPGDPVTADDLIAAGWPDERIARTAATNRLRVLVSGLRAEGLREIESTEGGYRLAPGIPVVRTD